MKQRLWWLLLPTISLAACHQPEQIKLSSDPRVLNGRWQGSAYQGYSAFGNFIVNNQVATLFGAGNVRFWSLENGESGLSLQLPERIIAMRSSNDGQRVALMADQGIYIVSALGEQLKVETKTPGLPLAFDNSNQLAVLWNNSVRVLDFNLGIERVALSVAGSGLTAAAFRGPDSLVTLGAQGEVYDWNLKTGRVVASLSKPAGNITMPTLSPDGRMYAYLTAGANPEIQVRSTGNGEILKRFTTLPIGPRWFFSWDSQQLVMSGTANLVSTTPIPPPPQILSQAFATADWREEAKLQLDARAGYASGYDGSHQRFFMASPRGITAYNANGKKVFIISELVDTRLQFDFKASYKDKLSYDFAGTAKINDKSYTITGSGSGISPAEFSNQAVNQPKVTMQNSPAVPFSANARLLDVEGKEIGFFTASMFNYGLLSQKNYQGTLYLSPEPGKPMQQYNLELERSEAIETTTLTQEHR
jgi:hypothetical protein